MIHAFLAFLVANLFPCSLVVDAANLPPFLQPDVKIARGSERA
jgi:hypothetical protein